MRPAPRCRTALVRRGLPSAARPLSLGHAQQLSILRYWDFNYSTAAELSASPRNDQSYIEQFRADTGRSRAAAHAGRCARGLLSQRWTGLVRRPRSGLAPRSKPIHAFTLTFEQAVYDESKIAQEMAAHAGASFIPFPSSKRTWRTISPMPSGMPKPVLSTVTESRSSCSAAPCAMPVTRSFSPAKARTRFSVVTRISAANGPLQYPGPGPRRSSAATKELNQNNPVSRGLLLPDGDALPLERSPADAWVRAHVV